MQRLTARIAIFCFAAVMVCARVPAQVYQHLEHSVESLGADDFRDSQPSFDIIDSHFVDGQACDIDCITCKALAPRWLARASAVYMDRMTENSLVLIQDSIDFTQQLNANDFNFGWSAGVDVSLARKTWYDCGFELRYLQPQRLSADAFVSIGGSDVVFNTTPPVVAPNVQSIFGRYQSELISFEANYLYAINDQVTYLAGYRYIGMDDDLGATLDAAPQTFLYQTSTRNDMNGAQVGVIGILPYPWLPCLCTSVVAKVGVFGTRATHESVIDTGAARLSIDVRSDRVSWAGEVGVSSELPLTEYLSIVGGYQMVWIESIAIASDQLAVSDFFNGDGIDDREGTIFHGGVAGIVLEL